MPNIINIDSKEFVRFTNKLEKLGRADLPVAVRSTLNNLAFKMKGQGSERGQIDIEAQKSFENRRNKTLFKAMTGVDKAKGLNIESMASKAGIIKRSGRDKLAEGLAQQQEGGSVKSGSTPTNTSRVGKSLKRRVKAINKIKNLVPVNLSNNSGKRFHARANQAYRSKRAILFTARDGNKFIGKIKRVNKGDSSGYRYEMDILYRINPSKHVKLTKKRPFVDNAAKQVMKTGPKEFEEQMNKRFKKHWEK